MKKKAKVGIALATFIVVAGGVLAILLSRNIVKVYKAPDGSICTLDLNTFRSRYGGYRWYADVTCKLSNAQSRIFGEALRQSGAIDIKLRYIKYSVEASKSTKSLKVLRRSYYDKSYAFIFADDDEYSMRLDPGSVGEAIYDAMQKEAMSRGIYY